MKVKAKQFKEAVKCPNCNWETPILFYFEGENPEEVGLCGQCFSEFLLNEKAEITFPENYEKANSLHQKK